MPEKTFKDHLKKAIEQTILVQIRYRHGKVNEMTDLMKSYPLVVVRYKSIYNADTYIKTMLMEIDEACPGASNDLIREIFAMKFKVHSSIMHHFFPFT